MLSLQIERRHDPAAVDQILRSLPEWFGIEEAIQKYVAGESRQDSFLAVMGSETVGVALVERHFAESAELALIAVHANYRGTGVGSALIDALQKSLISDGCALLQVHTVGPSFENDAYADTRSFYGRRGFLPLQEFDRIDWAGPSLVLVKALQV